MTLNNIRRLAGIVETEFAPWDVRLNEGSEAELIKQLKDLEKTGKWATLSGKSKYSLIGDYLDLKGYVDLGKDRPLKTYDGGPREAIEQAISLGMGRKGGKVAFIRDPQGTLTKEIVLKYAEAYLQDPFNGLFSAYAATNDGEAFADGPETFADGVWGYSILQAQAGAAVKALQADPPKVTVTRVEGKTGAGWKIESSRDQAHYDKITDAAAEEVAAKLAKQGIFPNPEYNSNEPLRKKWLAKAPKGYKPKLK